MRLLRRERVIERLLKVAALAAIGGVMAWGGARAMADPPPGRWWGIRPKVKTLHWDHVMSEDPIPRIPTRREWRPPGWDQPPDRPSTRAPLFPRERGPALDFGAR